MLLRSSFSNTKRFFQKTLRSFKSFFSPDVDYHKLPKTSPYNPYSFSTTADGGGGGGGLDMNAQINCLQQQKQEDLERFYSDFRDRWDSSDKGKAKKRNNNNNKMMMSTAATQEAKDQGMKGNFIQSAKATSSVKNKREDNRDDQYSKTRSGKVEKRREELHSKSKRVARSLSVEQKLKEMEMMDMSNVDHVLDIEEVLHYYSRLTCPAYLDIVDKFFMELYTEFLGPPAASPKSVNSRPKFRSLRA